MTAVAPHGVENSEDAYDQGLVELGLGDTRLIEAKGAMLPLNFRRRHHDHCLWARLLSAIWPHRMLMMVRVHVPEWRGPHVLLQRVMNALLLRLLAMLVDYEETSLLLRRNLRCEDWQLGI